MAGPTDGHAARRRSRALLTGWFAVAAVAAPQGDARAQAPPVITPTLSADLTYTNNVDLQPSSQREGDFILTISPGAAISYEGPRSVLRGSFSLPVSLYARTGERNNEVKPIANLFGSVEVVRDFFFVEARADVSQTYINPFGPRPIGLENETDNRYTSQNYQVSPYIQGRIGSNVFYRLRNNNTWSALDNSPLGSRHIYTNQLIGTIERDPTPWGWGFDLDRVDYDFPDQSRSQETALVRARLIWQPDPQLRLTASTGYEQNKFFLSEYEGPTYGFAVLWRPTPRTTLDAAWEKRFFGDSYRFAFNHRLPRMAFSVQASRDLSSYPEQLGTLPAGAFLPGILNEILANRITDPIERAQYIVQFISERGLPVFLADPLALYSQRLYLSEYAAASLGLIGVRNSVFFTAYRSQTQAISAGGEVLPPILNEFTNNEQLGGSAVWTYRVSSSSWLTVTGIVSSTESVDVGTDNTDQWSLRVSYTRTLSPKTTVFAGARYQALESNVTNEYREAAVFVGATHRFR